MSSTALETEAARSSYWAITEVVTNASSPHTTARPAINATPAAGRSRRYRRSRFASGVSAGAIVSATMIGTTTTRKYHSSTRTASAAAAQTSSLHDQPAARSRPIGTGGSLTGL